MTKYKKTSYSFKNEDDIINFGIYKGEKIIFIIENHLDYIDWCFKNFKEFKMNKKLKNIYNDKITRNTNEL